MLYKIKQIKFDLTIYFTMQELKLLHYREINRRIGWRATSDIIANHIFTMTTEPLDFEVIFYNKEWLDHSPIDRIKNKHVEEFFRRIQEAMCIIMCSFDDSPEDMVAAMQHLVHHWKLFDCYRKDVPRSNQLCMNFICHSVWKLWCEVTGMWPLDPECDIDSRFH